ncbi:MAG: pyridoxine 5'-phosphate synthase [Flavobacteriales bacterium]
MTKLSVNINKIATIRNARGGDMPNVLKAALDIEAYGAHGITVHPRPDERHIRFSDVRALATELSAEFNIEGYPSKEWMDLVLEVKPTQATLVPDPPNVLTSNAGWDTVRKRSELKEVLVRLSSAGIRTSIFVEPVDTMIRGAVEVGADRVELYTGPYAENYSENRQRAVKPFASAAKLAVSLGLGVNAGHDLSLENLAFFRKSLPALHEVSIGHALISDALYFGLENTVQMYLSKLA